MPFWLTPKSARCITATVMRAWARAYLVAGSMHRSFRISATYSANFSGSAICLAEIVPAGLRAQRGADLREDITIEFEEAAFGTEKKITYRKHETCEKCNGSGSAQGKAPAACRSCGGRGQVRYQQGFFSIARTCPTCHGAGSVISDPCTNCRGEGRVVQQKTIDAKFPPGWRMELAFALPVWVKQAFTADLQAICTSFFG